jgi:hypothetical protein
VQKRLEGANIKLGDVASAGLGVSGRAMRLAISAGNTAAEALADLARGRRRAKLPQLRPALDGRIQGEQRFVLS